VARHADGSVGLQNRDLLTVGSILKSYFLFFALNLSVFV
jgi:hypothetical protein